MTDGPSAPALRDASTRTGPYALTGLLVGAVAGLVSPVTASALKLALGMVALLAGLGAINLLLGAGLVWTSGAGRTGGKASGHADPMSTLEQGIEATWRLIADPALDGVNGAYFDVQRETRADPQAYDADARRRLRELSERLVAGA